MKPNAVLARGRYLRSFLCLLFIANAAVVARTSLGFDFSTEFRRDYFEHIDFFLSTGIYAVTPHRLGDFSVFCTFGWRPGERETLVRTGAARYDQEKEKRTFLIFGIDETLALSQRAALYGTAGYGYSWAWFKSFSDEENNNGGTGQLGAGLQLTLSNPSSDGIFALRGGYVYRNFKDIKPHGIRFSLLLIF